MNMESNYQKAANQIRAAANQGAHLAVLPEYHLLNWVPNDPKYKENCREWKTYLERYQALAKECNINLVPGTIIELHDEGTPQERLLNVAYFISNTGEILHRYQKKNLWGSIERDHLTSSTHDPHVAFDTPLGKVGMLICWDLAFPEAFRELISQGAKLIVIPTFWTLSDCSKEGLAINPTSEALFLDSIMVSRCFENTCGTLPSIRCYAGRSHADRITAIAFANAGGPSGKGYAGVSQICMPYAGAVARLGSHAEGMAVADIDMQILEYAEENYQVRTDLASSDWHYTYRHSKDGAKL
jgi:predicted amidohydrolase